MTQFVGDLEHAGDLPIFETAAGGSGWRVGGSQLAAFKSCARQLDLPIEIVLRAAGTNRLGALIEARNGSGRNVAMRNVARIDSLYRRRELAARLVPPWS